MTIAPSDALEPMLFGIATKGTPNGGRLALLLQLLDLLLVPDRLPVDRVLESLEHGLEVREPSFDGVDARRQPLSPACDQSLDHASHVPGA
jgi:hypothetical protein